MCSQRVRNVLILLSSTSLLSSFLYISLYVEKSRISTLDDNVLTQHGLRYADGMECNESVYKFSPNSTENTIFSDRDLWASCGINDTMGQTEAEPFNTPRVRTKCTTADAILLSARRVEITPRPGFLVPNIVHYVLFGSTPFTFLNYLSFRSTGRFIEPQFIFVHGDGLMNGHWWNRTLEEVDNVYYVHRPQIQRIQNKKPGNYAHQSDIIRLQILQGEYSFAKPV